MEATQVSTNRLMYKEDTYCKMEYNLVIKKNKILPFAVTWMDSEVIMLNEMSDKKTNTE